MTTAVQHRRGTTAEHAAFTGLEGELTIDTTKDTAVIHDGTLAGGYPLAKENLANVTTSGLSSIDGASTASDDKFFIYDQSATSLKTITRAELNNAIEQDALANVAITGGTINGTTIGTTTAAAVSATTLTTSSTVTHNGGTANGVAYLNGSKVLTTGSVLTFDGAILGVNGVSVGRGAGAVATNTAVGASAFRDNTTGKDGVALGNLALRGNTTGVSNIAIGSLALLTNTTGSYNTAVGSGEDGFTQGALGLNSTGSYNTGVGYQAVRFNTTASNNTAVGYQAGYSNTTGVNLTAVGSGALMDNTTGGGNVAMGHNSLGNNTTGGGNAAFGGQWNSVTNATLFQNTTGSYNTAVGIGALSENTTASNNTAVGYQAGYSNTTGTQNTLLGNFAGYTRTTGSYNTLVGMNAGYYGTTGSSNTFVGCGPAGNGAGQEITTGSKNTILGGYNGNQGGLDIRTSNGNIVLSDGDGNPRAYWDSSTSRFYMGATASRTYVANGMIGDKGATGNNISILFGTDILPGDGSGTAVDNTKNFGSGAYRWATIYAGTGTINTSDANTKQDIEDLSEAERLVAVRIKSLIKKYRFKDAVAEKGDAARIHVGVIAQEVQVAFTAEGLDASRYALFCSDTWYEVDGQGLDENKRAFTSDAPGAVEKTRLGIRYDELLAFVIAAI